VIGDNPRAELVRTLYRHTTPILFANVCNALVVGVVLWGSVSRALLLGWGALHAVTLFGRGVLRVRYDRSDVPPKEALRWAKHFTVGSAASGSLWGAAAVLFFPGASPFAQLLISFVVGGMCAAAAGTLAGHAPAFFAFVLPALGSLGLYTAISGPPYLALAAMIAVYGVALSSIAKNNRRALTEAFVLRFENAELLKTLSAAQASLEESNRTLERRVAERTLALEEQAAALRDARRMESIGRLAGGVAHDFNNLLTVILSNVDELSRSPTLDDDARDALRDTSYAANRAAELVQQLLAFSRRQAATPVMVDLNQLLGAMDRLLVRLMGEHYSLRLVLHEAPLVVSVDPIQIQQVIMNLVTNAREAMPDGGTVRIETFVAEAPGTMLDEGLYAVLSVSDTGVGMDAHTRARAFEPFYTTKEIGKGSGLGLAAAYGAVEQSGGRIEVTSEPGRGSCFRVYLPLAPPAAEARPETPTEARRASGLPAVPRPAGVATILLVEDEFMMRAVAARMLESQGHLVLVAHDSAEAIALAAQCPYPIDVLITVVAMPGLDGPALSQHLRETTPELKTLFIGAHDRELEITGGFETKSALLSKPFTRDELLARVTELLGHAS
jgi:two-component system cell cycle sensor histidine kinase/response regulator CckA